MHLLKSVPYVSTLSCWLFSGVITWRTNTVLLSGSFFLFLFAWSFSISTFCFYLHVTSSRLFSPVPSMETRSHLCIGNHRVQSEGSKRNALPVIGQLIQHTACEGVGGLLGPKKEFWPNLATKACLVPMDLPLRSVLLALRLQLRSAWAFWCCVNGAERWNTQSCTVPGCPVLLPLCCQLI